MSYQPAASTAPISTPVELIRDISKSLPKRHPNSARLNVKRQWRKHIRSTVEDTTLVKGVIHVHIERPGVVTHPRMQIGTCISRKVRPRRGQRSGPRKAPQTVPHWAALALLSYPSSDGVTTWSWMLSQLTDGQKPPQPRPVLGGDHDHKTTRAETSQAPTPAKSFSPQHKSVCYSKPAQIFL